jgi:hypothetical protein
MMQAACRLSTAACVLLTSKSKEHTMHIYKIYSLMQAAGHLSTAVCVDSSSLIFTGKLFLCNNKRQQN